MSAGEDAPCLQALTLASLLAGAADRLHEQHGIDRHVIVQVFQEASRVRV